MELQIIQTRSLIAPVLGSRCEDCEKEEIQETLEEERLREESLIPGDQVTISEAARRSAEIAGRHGDGGSRSGGNVKTSPNTGASTQPQTEVQLTEEERQMVEELRTRDREVRAHEQAHKAVAGGYARGGATFEYQTGPDGQRYAVSGEVSIDTSPVPGDPQATIIKAQTIRRAALAPSKPSEQDRSVAAQATQMENEARAELREERAEEQKEATESNDNTLTAQQTVSEKNTEDKNTDQSSTSQDNLGNPFARRAIGEFEPTVSVGDIVDIIS